MKNRSTKERLAEIEDRNRRVTTDKEWETSLSRKIILSVMTYFCIALFFCVSKIGNPFINALVPTLGFLLSGLSLPFFKKIWIKLKRK